MGRTVSRDRYSRARRTSRPASATSPGWTCSIRSTRTVASQSPVAVSVVIFEPSTTARTRWRLSGSRSSSEAIAAKPVLVASFGSGGDERAMVRIQSWSRSGGGGGEGDDRPWAASDVVAHGGSRHHWTGRRAARGALTGAGPHRGGPPRRGQRPPRRPDGPLLRRTRQPPPARRCRRQEGRSTLRAREDSNLQPSDP